MRLSSSDQFKSHMKILGSFARELNSLRQAYPVTIVYMKMKYCGMAFWILMKKVEDYPEVTLKKVQIVHIVPLFVSESVTLFLHIVKSCVC